MQPASTSINRVNRFGGAVLFEAMLVSSGGPVLRDIVRLVDCRRAGPIATARHPAGMPRGAAYAPIVDMLRAESAH